MKGVILALLGLAFSYLGLNEFNEVYSAVPALVGGVVALSEFINNWRNWHGNAARLVVIGSAAVLSGLGYILQVGIFVDMTGDALTATIISVVALSIVAWDKLGVKEAIN